MSDNEPDGYYGQACYEVASAIRALGEGEKETAGRSDPAPEMFPGTLAALDNLTIRPKEGA